MISKKKFAKLFGSMSALLVVVTAIMVSTGTVMAIPIAGIGGFTQEVDSLTAEEFYMYPSMSDTDDPENRIPAGSAAGIGQYPTAATELAGAEIEGLQLYKVFTLSDYDDVSAIASLIGADPAASARVLITADDVTSNGPLLVEQSSLEAESAEFNGLEVITQEGPLNPGHQNDEYNLLDQPSKLLQRASADTDVGTRYVGNITGSSPALSIQNATIKAHYLAAENMQMEGMDLTVQLDLNGDGTYEFGQAASP